MRQPALFSFLRTVTLSLVLFGASETLMSPVSRAQEASEVHEAQTKPGVVSRLILNDGSYIYGEIITVNPSIVILDSVFLGRLQIQRAFIKEIEYDVINAKNDALINPATQPDSEPIQSEVVPSEARPGNPTATRLLFAPTARNLKPGKGYIQDIYVFVAAANIGVTENFSIGGMATIVPFIPFESQIYAITPKFSYEVDDLNHVAVGALYAFSPNNIGQMALGYGLYTLGSEDSNVSLGAGLGSAFSSGSSGGLAGFLMLGGMHRLADNMALISENWLAMAGSSALVIPSLGVRFFGGNLSADFALTYPIFNGMPAPVPIPYLDFVFSF